MYWRYTMTINQYTAIIWLTQGKYTIVDCEDYEFLMQWKWCCANGYAVNGGYAARRQKKLIMHRLVNKTPEDLVTDHINGNTFDNRKENLRACTKAQNSKNARIRGGSSQFKGVCWEKSCNKWSAKIATNGTRLYLGCFNSEIEAAVAYDKMAVMQHGEFARLNF